MKVSDVLETNGTVVLHLFDAAGNVEVLVLASGFHVYLPLHMSDAIRAAGAFAITGTHGEMRRALTCDWCLLR